MENYLKVFIDEISNRILYKKCEIETKEFKSFFENIVKKYPLFPEILLVNNSDDKALNKMKLEEMYHNSSSNKQRLISIIIAAYLFYREVKLMPEIDTLVLPTNTSTVSVGNNYICKKCSKPEKFYFCPFCKKRFLSKDGRYKHKSRCESNPTPKTKRN